MGDFHFLLRHALTGGVLLLFVFNGLTIFHPALGQRTLEWMISLDHLEHLSKLLPILISAPILGIGVQGLHVAVLHWRRLAFTDPARLQIADRIRDVMLSGSWGLPQDAATSYARAAQDIPPDAVFVWLYHTAAPPHQIEWARRRRSYAYLGWNWAIAAGLGIVLGASSPWFVQFQPDQPPIFNMNGIVVALMVFSALWLWGTIYLARVMKRDADKMELIWSYAQLYPHLKEGVAAVPLPASQVAASASDQRRGAARSRSRPYEGGV